MHVAEVCQVAILLRVRGGGVQVLELGFDLGQEGLSVARRRTRRGRCHGRSLGRARGDVHEEEDDEAA
jgi:hypothetical protein